MEPVRDRCCCPTFLVALAGPWMCILGAVFVDHVVVQRLTNFIWIGGDPYNDDELKLVTRILASLRTGIVELKFFTRGYLIHKKIPNVSSHLFGSTLLESMSLDSRTRTTSCRKLRMPPPRPYSKLPKPSPVERLLSSLFKDIMLKHIASLHPKTVLLNCFIVQRRILIPPTLSD